MVRVFVSSRARVNDLLSSLNKDNLVVISITDPDRKNPQDQIAQIKGVSEDNILRLSFYDLDKQLTDKGKDLLIFNKDMALEIKSFIIGHILACELKGAILSIVVHCEAGISRSAGCAGAIVKFFNGDCSEFFKTPFIPNRLVFKTLLDCLNGEDNPIPKVEIVTPRDIKDMFI